MLYDKSDITTICVQTRVNIYFPIIPLILTWHIQFGFDESVLYLLDVTTQSQFTFNNVLYLMQHT